jgi:hypothetical protein
MCYLSSAEKFGRGLLFLFNIRAIDVIVGRGYQYSIGSSKPQPAATLH